jgi:protease I
LQTIVMEEFAMTQTLLGKKVAILVTDGFEQIEMTSPRLALLEAGAEAVIVSPKDGEVQGWKHRDKSDRFSVNVNVAHARAEDYDALMLPGGVMNSDQLRQDAAAVRFVKGFVDAKKPIAAICHAPWILTETNALRGRRVTSYPSLATDLKNAGAEWIDAEMVCDSGLVTSRRPSDLPAFNAKMIEEIGEGVHDRRVRAKERGAPEATA